MNVRLELSPALKQKISILRRKKDGGYKFYQNTVETYTVHKVQEKPHFCNICPCAKDIVYARFQDVRFFLHVFQL